MYRIRGELRSPDTLNYSSTFKRYPKGQAVETTVTSSSVLSPVSPGRVCKDIVTPRFRERQARGEIINSPFEIYENSYTVQPYTGPTQSLVYPASQYPNVGDTMSAEWSLTDWPYLGSATVLSALPLRDFTSLEIDAVNAAFANSHQRDVLGIVDLAEIRKTISLLTGSMNRLNNLLEGGGRPKVVPAGLGAKRLKHTARSAAGKLSDLAGLQLELNYGWIPLMLTIDGLVKVLFEQAYPLRQTFRGFKHQTAEDTESVTNNFTDGYGSRVSSIHTSTREISFMVRAGVLAETKVGLQGRLGFELRDIPVAAYELLPYSFVLDWFFDLNTAIEAAIPISDQKILASWSTMEVQEDISSTMTVPYFTGTHSTNLGVLTVFARSHTGTTSRFYKIRKPGVTPSFPRLNFNYKSLNHLVSGIALLFSKSKTRMTARI